MKQAQGSGAPGADGRDRRGAAACLAAAFAIYAVRLAISLSQVGWSGVRWRHYSALLPTGLLVLVGLNRTLRSRVLAWGCFSLAFVFFIVVMGAFVVQSRAGAPSQWFQFGSAMAMYAALVLAALFQLRTRSSA